MGPPIGACAVRDPRLDALARRFRWVVTLANLPILAETVHRFLATSLGPEWVEPAPADMEWKLARNTSSSWVVRWSALAPEPSYAGQVFLDPQEDDVPAGSIWTDGSVGPSGGGAAAYRMSTHRQQQCRVAEPRSSTKCEQVALSLVACFHPAPREFLPTRGVPCS